MRRTQFIPLVAALSAMAQVSTMGPSAAQPEQPSWMEVFKKVYGPPGQRAPLGSLDSEVERSWGAALAAGPAHPSFVSAAQQTAQYFASQGYDRKAEAILRQAISAAGQARVEQADPAKAQSLRLALAQRFSQEQRLLAAAVLTEAVLEEIKGAPDRAAPGGRISALLQLAQLRERMGELETAEALLREAKTLQSALAVPRSSASGPQFARAAMPGTTGFVRGGFSGSYAGGTDLAGFYQRNGDTAKAEGLLQKELAEAKAPEEVFRALQSYGHFLISQQRWEEGAAQWEKLIALQSASARPEDRQALTYTRVNLAHALMSGGKGEKALEILRAQVAQASGEPYQRVDALRTYASMLIQQQQFEEAEKIVEQLRQPATFSGRNAAEMNKQAETMADHLLADIRQRQNRGDEARALRERTMAQAPSPEGAGAPVPLWNLLQPVQELLRRQKYDEAMAQAQQILAEGLPRIRSHPEEIAAFSNLIHGLPQGRQEERLQWIRTLLTTLDGVRPADHPLVAQALGQFVGSAMQAGLSADEITRLLESEEKILVAAKGEDSPALNDVSRQRAQFHTFRGDYADAAAEMKRALKRTEAASGIKSQMALQMMRELIGALQMTGESWPEEERLRLALIERSGPSAGMGGSVVQDMSMLASRYFTLGQREAAVSWMDRAIESAKKNPHTASAVQQFEQQRNHFASSQNQPQPGANPYYAPASGRWFNTGEFSNSQGARLGGRPMPGGVLSTGGTPAPPPPPPPPPKQ